MVAKKILLVDDDKDLVTTLSQALVYNNFYVVEAYSAAEGLKKVLSEKPDLVIFDVMMETDTAGFEAVYQIRSKRDTSKYKEVKDVPIIMLTAINQVTNSRFSLNAEQSFLPSINDFLTKPIDIDELIEKINRYI
ncbi:MAG TPA: response regulator [Spirochaetota bacterium]|nr:response regulator [Spirochaetota bacterium]HPF05847.1 response regulator [Spirochaetota bacterium]HPJ43517.1 response regulator [Spirochaetota bacterium]HPR38723.1 response regulator [Spirochaetota bacterium]HRX48792.1 response regulator [Spirochaetota bacterium]